ncbi:MAG: GDP-mannose 4,6-dehydratase [Planctomycetes bacterium]|nr:GDP-mannose 4,6-dehydratase [Planctomycetota bacterium]
MNKATNDLSSPLAWLITGGAGFIGSHLADRLLAAGHTVLALDDLSTGRLENVAHLADDDRFELHRGDIRDNSLLDELAQRSRIIVHLAAAVGVQLIVEAPVKTIETNVLGTQVVLEAALRHRCRVLVASSSEVYGKGTKIPFAEDDDVLLGPTSRNRWAYAVSKMVDEFLALAYHRERELETICVRLFNTVGPRQTGRYGMVVPRLMSQALRGEPLTVYGDGNQSRCFCDVRDVTDAIARLATHSRSTGQVFNIGGTEEISIRDLAARVLQVTGSQSGVQLIPYDEAYAPGFEDMQRRVPDLRRIESLLGWRPSRTLDQILSGVRDGLAAAVVSSDASQAH